MHNTYFTEMTTKFAILIIKYLLEVSQIFFFLKIFLKQIY